VVLAWVFPKLPLLSHEVLTPILIGLLSVLPFVSIVVIRMAKGKISFGGLGEKDETTITWSYIGCILLLIWLALSYDLFNYFEVIICSTVFAIFITLLAFYKVGEISKSRLGNFLIILIFMTVNWVLSH